MCKVVHLSDLDEVAADFVMSMGEGVWGRGDLRQMAEGEYENYLHGLSPAPVTVTQTASDFVVSGDSMF